MILCNILGDILGKARKRSEIVFFLLIFSSFFLSSGAPAVDSKGSTVSPQTPDAIEEQIIKKINDSGPQLKVSTSLSAEVQRSQIEDPVWSGYFKEFCPDMNYFALKKKWEINRKIYNDRIEKMKSGGPEKMKWPVTNLGANFFLPKPNASFNLSRARPVSSPHERNIKVFLDQKLREIYSQCDFKLTRKIKGVSAEIIQHRKAYLNDLAMVHPEQVLDSEMGELKKFEPFKAGDIKSSSFLIITAHGYKVRFVAPGEKVVHQPIRWNFLVRASRDGTLFLDKIQELLPDPNIPVPTSEIQRAKMDPIYFN